MRDLVLYIAMSLDGFIAKENGDISFLSIVEDPTEDYGYEKFANTIDTVIMGRKTYEKILSMGPYPHPGIKSYVLSKSREGNDENVEFYNGDLKLLIQNLKAQNGKNIFIDGGAETVNELMKQDLIDKYIISIIPVHLGDGIRLFKQERPEQKLKLISSEAFPSGLVQLSYERIFCSSHKTI